MAQPGDAGPRRGAARRRLPTTPLRDLRRRDSRSRGRNVPRAPGSRKSGGCPSLLPPHPRVPSPHGPPPPVHSLSSSASPLFPKNETSFQRTPSLQRSAPVIPGNCPFRATLRVSSYPPDPTEVSIHYPPKHPRSSPARPSSPGMPRPEGRRGAAPPLTPFTCCSG